MLPPDPPPHSAAVESAERMSATLREAAPVPGFQGFVRFSRGGVGQSFDAQCRAARALPPTSDAMTSEAWTKPQSFAAAGRCMLRGKGIRVDMQDMHTRDEVAFGLDALLSARSRQHPETRATGNQTDRANRPPRVLGWDPGPKPKITNPAALGPAGQPSISAKLDGIRWEDYRKEKFAAIRNNEIPSAIRR